MSPSLQVVKPRIRNVNAKAEATQQVKSAASQQHLLSGGLGAGSRPRNVHRDLDPSATATLGGLETFWVFLTRGVLLAWSGWGQGCCSTPPRCPRKQSSPKCRVLPRRKNNINNDSYCY